MECKVYSSNGENIRMPWKHKTLSRNLVKDSLTLEIDNPSLKISFLETSTIPGIFSWEVKQLKVIFDTFSDYPIEIDDLFEITGDIYHPLYVFDFHDGKFINKAYPSQSEESKSIVLVNKDHISIQKVLFSYIMQELWGYQPFRSYCSDTINASTRGKGFVSIFAVILGQL